MQLIDRVISLSKHPEATRNSLVTLGLKIHLEGNVYDSGLSDVDAQELDLKRRILPKLVASVFGNLENSAEIKEIISKTQPKIGIDQFSSAYDINEIFYKIRDDNNKNHDVIKLIQEFRIILLVSISMFSAITLEEPNTEFNTYILGLGSLFEVSKEEVTELIIQTFQGRE